MYGADMSLSSPCRSTLLSQRAVADKLLRDMANYRQELGLRLAALRRSRSMSQEDAAHTARVAVKTWRNWEGGKTSLYESSWRKLQAGFGLSDDQVATLRGTPPAPLGLGDADPYADRLDRIEAMLGLLLTANFSEDEVEKILAEDRRRRLHIMRRTREEVAREASRGTPPVPPPARRE